MRTNTQVLNEDSKVGGHRSVSSAVAAVVEHTEPAKGSLSMMTKASQVWQVNTSLEGGLMPEIPETTDVKSSGVA